MFQTFCPKIDFDENLTKDKIHVKIHIFEKETSILFKSRILFQNGANIAKYSIFNNSMLDFSYIPNHNDTSCRIRQFKEDTNRMLFSCFSYLTS